ncbi:DNA-binding transcriptional ArsR family regulator [Bacillus pakistanensis]|uniref:DNA-binding transcriptional ArsR family regulator n=1 Tax=Rossellomorea pakistanensis TaxID=992288 RepID=A0ABS2NFI0_9BACI|nr:metalloregulator ArsR/SmtB family transcription factor [Bacillus pakistanensis]MBM7586604.1 DNA-binding transcriptional ArsR family regulator [Bacillus pakistanensis]
MQLNKQVSFYKTLGDSTRLKIIYILSSGRLHVGAIAGKLGLTPPTISHHFSKLKEINLVYSRREKNTMYYYLNEKVMKHHAQVLLNITQWREEENTMSDDREKEKQKVLNNFFTPDGKLKSIPAQRKKKLFVFEHMVEGLKTGVKYEEKAMNEYIKRFHDDFATIRREFIINQYMFREAGIYELNPKELWAKID